MQFVRYYKGSLVYMDVIAKFLARFSLSHYTGYRYTSPPCVYMSSTSHLVCQLIHQVLGMYKHTFSEIHICTYMYSVYFEANVEKLLFS